MHFALSRPTEGCTLALPSLLDTLIVVALIIPGFVAFSIARRLAISERKFPEFETLVWSLLLSLGIYCVFASATGVRGFDSVRDKIFLPLVLFALVAFTVLTGVLVGLSWHLAVNRGVRPEFGNPWDIFFDAMRKSGRDLVVFTSDGLEFRGWVGPSGKEDNRLELILEHPRLIVRDQDRAVVSETEYGQRLLFTEGDIKRVAMLQPR